MKSVLKTVFSAVLCTALGVFALTGAAQAQSVGVGPMMRSGEIIVEFPPAMTSAQVQAVLTGANCEVVRQLRYRTNIYVVGVKGRESGLHKQVDSTVMESLNSLKSHSGVQAGPNYLFEKRGGPVRQKTRASEPPGPTFVPDDPQYPSTQWHLDMIRMPEAWAFQNGDGTPVKVAIIDSGLEVSHPDFVRADGTRIIVDSQNFNGGPVGGDGDGHGTHVAGTVAAATNNGIGVASVGGLGANGVNIQLMGLGIGDANGSLSYAAAIDALDHARLNGARVTTMSFGGPLASAQQVPGLIPALRACIDAGLVMVGASGNGGPDNIGDDLATAPDFPTDVPGVIKVNAVGPDKILASYSNYGGSNKQMIAAPGGDDGQHVQSTTVGGTYGAPQYQGTSMACPHVAGAAALLIAAGATAAEVYPALAATAQAPGEPLDTNKYGPGIIDVYSALVLVSNPTPRILPVNPSVVDRGVTYLSPIGIRARIFGAVNMLGGNAALKDKQVRQSDVNVDLYRVGEATPFRTFQGGRDFLIPALRTGERKVTVFDVDIPSKADNPTLRPTDPGVDLPDVNLTPGYQYKIVYRVGTRVYGTQFITVAARTQPAGRSMFALPFKAELATGLPTGATKEQLLLGPSTTFSLARYNPLRLPSEEDYARYSSNGSLTSPSARFLMSNLASGPLTYDIGDPGRSIAPIGVGYWLDLSDAATIDTLRLTAGRDSAAGIEATNAVAIRIFASGGGWNMIGAPFTFPVEWSSVTIQVGGVNYSLSEAVNNGFISSALVGYDPERRDYAYSIAPEGVLRPFNAYWVRALRDATIIVPPAQAVATRAAGRPGVSGGWMARLTASVAGDQDGQNYFGQAPGAAEGVDRLDVLKPPAGAGHAYVRFEQAGTSGTRALAFDLRQAGATEKQQWRAAVTSARANADVTLSWEGMRLVPRRYKISLRDEATGQVVAMQSRASYRFRSGEAGSTRYFQIVLEPQPSSGALLFSNVRTEPGTRSQRGGTAIRFTLNQDSEIVGTVRTLSGKTVGTLIGESRAVAGKETTLRWGGRAQDGSSLPAGTYLLDVSARTADGSSVRMTRTVQHLR